MPDVKISALPAATVPLAGTEVLPIVQSATTRQVSVANLTAGRAISASSITNSALTSGRVTYAGASGLLTDSAGLTYNGASLTISSGASASALIATSTSAGGTALNIQNSGTVNALIGGYLSCIGSGSATDVAIAAYQGALAFATNGANERMRIDSSGNVGIGTTTPSASGTGGTSRVLEVNGAAGYGILNLSTTATANGSTSGILQFCSELGSDDRLAIISAVKDDASTTTPKGYLYFGTANAGGVAERMRINSSGNVGINIDTPVSKLDVRAPAGEIARFVTKASAGECYILVGADASTTEGLRLTYDNADGSSTINNFYPAALKFKTNNTQRMSIDLNGIVTMNAYGVGTATFSATGVISSVSDETWKTKDGVPTNPDTMLQKLDPGYWFYNEEKASIFGEDRQLGFYAQNVHEAIGAEAAPTPDEGKPWGYYDRSVLAIAVMSLKNALNTIEELKQRIEILENK